MISLLHCKWYLNHIDLTVVNWLINHKSCDGLVKHSIFIVMLGLLGHIAGCTKKYAYDWVVPKNQWDCDANTTKCPILSPIFVPDGVQPLPNARYHANEAPLKPTITLNLIIAWFGIAILARAYAGGTNNCCIWSQHRIVLTFEWIFNMATSIEGCAT